MASVQVTYQAIDLQTKSLSALEGVASIVNVTGQTLCKDSTGKIIGIIPHTSSILSIKLVS